MLTIRILPEQAQEQKIEMRLELHCPVCLKKRSEEKAENDKVIAITNALIGEKADKYSMCCCCGQWMEKAGRRMSYKTRWGRYWRVQLCNRMFHNKKDGEGG